MPELPSTPVPAPQRRRDLQKEQTRLDLALAAFELARTEGLANLRVPQIAESIGVSTRTFNNYFPSKEAAIVWPATLRGAQLISNVDARPSGELLADALVEAVAGLYGPGSQDGLPKEWLGGFRALVATEPMLQGEYLKTQAAGERALADAIARRTGAEPGSLRPLVLAGVVIAAERAAVLHWSGQSTRSTRLIEVVRTAVALATSGTAFTGITLR
ncbi:TetR family transcriptional regulator [Actinoplanes sp. NPDC051343]|uniref:acyl-CoA-like ligand-binding transcription factor n=1 Tax=Actinoplanes sp. NPDC051343 TaxID=3363906 RepID=UPI00378A8DCF